MNGEILYITRRLGFPSSFGTRSGLGDFLERYPDGIYAETGTGAPIGWEGAAVWFGGGSERAAYKFERMVAERNDVSRLFRTRVSGVLLLTFLYRLKRRGVTAIPMGGGAQPEPDALNFTMPNGGTITLTRNGTPTIVTLEYSTDGGATWTEWTASGTTRTLTLNAGEKVYIRNTSTSSTMFSINLGAYYKFAFSDTAEAHGNCNSLLCKNPGDAVITEYCYTNLFNGCTTLVIPPELPSETLATRCYIYMFKNCDNMTATPSLPSETLANGCYYQMFSGCNMLSRVETYMTDLSAGDCLMSWLYGVAATGDFWCDPDLTIATGASGIPSGWTRHDINEL